MPKVRKSCKGIDSSLIAAGFKKNPFAFYSILRFSTVPFSSWGAVALHDQLCEDQLGV